MQCPTCGYVQQPFDRVCPKCSALARTGCLPLPPAPTVAGSSPAGAAPQTAWKACPTCRLSVAYNCVVCPRCACRFGPYEISSPIPPTPQPTMFVPLSEISESIRSDEKRRGKRQVAVLACASVVLLVVAVGIANVMTARPRGSTHAATSGGGNGAGMFGAVGSDQIESRLAHESATTGGDLEISLAWNSLSDIDLQVTDPSGEEVSASHPRSESGGVQDVDANPTLLTPEGERRALMGQVPGGENTMALPEMLVDTDRSTGMPAGFPDLGLGGFPGRAPGHWTRQPIEHVFFARAPSGVYSVRVHCYSWREPDPTPLPFTVEIRSHGSIVSRKIGTIGPASFASDGAAPTEACRYNYH